MILSGIMFSIVEVVFWHVPVNSSLMPHLLWLPYFYRSSIIKRYSIVNILIIQQISLSWHSVLVLTEEEMNYGFFGNARDLLT